MSTEEQQQRHIFIIRVWQDTASRTWRGQAEHVESKQQYYFSTLADLNTFIRLRIRQTTDSEPHSKF
jgi:hypothetical protein